MENIEDMKGNWTLTGTSGGITGGGYDAPFDNMEIDKDLNFTLFNGTVKIAEGQIMEKESDQEYIFLEFDGTKETPTLWIDLIDDNEKYLRFEGHDKMDFIAPCCDRFNLNWEKS